MTVAHASPALATSMNTGRSVLVIVVPITISPEFRSREPRAKHSLQVYTAPETVF